jgi:curved DNA-binding protein CbpA
MIDPYRVLGLPADSDDETIRRRYLELVKQYPPSRDPEKFHEVRDAYERLKDLETRVELRIFEEGSLEVFDKLIEDLESKKNRQRVTFEQLMNLVRK